MDSIYQCDATVLIADISKLPDHSIVRIQCNFTNIKEILTKSGGLMCFATADDASGSIEVVVFADVYSDISALLKSGIPFLVVGMYEHDKSGDKLLVTKKLCDNSGKTFSGNIELSEY